MKFFRANGSDIQVDVNPYLALYISTADGNWRRLLYSVGNLAPWSPTMVESIIDSLKEYKSLCEFNATDFNADKVKLYEKVQQMMARKYASENYFGPVEKTVAEKPVKEMSKEEYKAYKAVHDKEAEMIRTETVSPWLGQRGQPFSHINAR